MTAESQDGTDPGTGGPDGIENEGEGDAREKEREPVILSGISARSWEHPADRVALGALRRIPIFDLVLRRIFGFFGEKPIRLAFQANALRVSERQYPRLHGIYREVCGTLDIAEPYPLFVSQTPIVNAGAYGMDRPFILLNSGTIALLDDREIAFVLGHELGHIRSGHVLYRTMAVLLIRLADMGFPIVGIAARAVLMALLEWSRKSELSSDRAGLLAIQDPEVAMRTMMKMAGGGGAEEPDLSEFLRQAEEYRTDGDAADAVFRVLNLLGMSHPFFVLRVGELRRWIEDGAYDRILRGEYLRREDADPDLARDLRIAAEGYAREAKDFVEEIAETAKRWGGSFREGLGF